MSKEQNNSFQEIWEKLKSSDNILMSLHYGPDGDSLGSCAAMKYILEKLGKNVKLVSKDRLSGALEDFSFSNEVDYGEQFDESKGNYDVFLSLDCASPEMFSENFNKDIFIVNIDHHHTNTHYGDLNYVGENPSACSVLVNMFRDLSIEFDKELSTRLLLGICTDSGFFSYEIDDFKELFADVSFLVENGADYYNDIYMKILGTVPLKLKKYYGILFKNLEVNREKYYAWSYATNEEIKKLGLNLAEVRLGVNQLQGIEGTEFSFTLSEMDDHIKFSVRSSRRVDVSLFAKELGGGGHKPAAGAYLRNMNLEEAKNKVFEAIEKVGIQRF